MTGIKMQHVLNVLLTDVSSFSLKGYTELLYGSPDVKCTAHNNKSCFRSAEYNTSHRSYSIICNLDLLDKAIYQPISHNQVSWRQFLTNSPTTLMDNYMGQCINQTLL